MSVTSAKDQVSAEEMSSVLTTLNTRSLEESGMCSSRSQYYEFHGVEPGYEEVFDKIKRAVDQGEDYAMFALGRRYEQGQGLVQDHERALMWYHRAAQEGNMSAQHILAWKYMNGEGVEKDEAKAIGLYIRSAKQGSVPSQYSLAKLFRDGKGVPKNLVTAYAWMNLASYKEHYLEMHRNDIATMMTPEQISQGQQLSQQLSQEIYGHKLTFN